MNLLRHALLATLVAACAGNAADRQLLSSKPTADMLSCARQPGHCGFTASEMAAEFVRRGTLDELLKSGQSCERAPVNVLASLPLDDLQCTDRTAVIELLGRCKHSGSASLLIDQLDTGCLTTAGSALNSLKSIFPGSPAEFRSREEAKKYFRARRRTQKQARQTDP